MQMNISRVFVLSIGQQSRRTSFVNEHSYNSQTPPRYSLEILRGKTVSYLYSLTRKRDVTSQVKEGISVFLPFHNYLGLPS